MKKAFGNFDQIKIAKNLLYWTILVIPVAVAAGSLVAFFLWLLDFVTHTRWQQPWLLFLLPLAGIIIAILYSSAGKNIDAGNNLILDEIHKPGGAYQQGWRHWFYFQQLSHIYLEGQLAGKEPPSKWADLYPHYFLNGMG